MRLILAILATLLLSATGSWAFGPTGHSIVAELAQRRLTPAAAEAVAKLIGPGVSLASVSNWADDYKFVFGGQKTKRWHFEDIDVTTSATVVLNTCEEQVEGDCISNALEREVDVLTSSSASYPAKVSALKFVVHLLGDIHQPLHCSERNGDGGGNGQLIQFAGNGPDNKPLSKPGNFHQLWDDLLVDAHTFSWGAYVEEIEYSVIPGLAAENLANGLDADRLVDECHKIGVAVYGLLPVSSGTTPVTVDATYQKAVQPILDRQLARGGLRLAALLNYALDR